MKDRMHTKSGLCHFNKGDKMKRKQKASERDIPRINNEFKKLSDLYPGTKYGTIAAAQNGL
jgi:hypothetical protein